MRAISTVLDVTLCLLFVTASAATLVGTPLETDSNPDAADRTLELLTTTTASVTYDAGDRTRTVHDHARTAHDTLAGLLVAATNADHTAFQQAVTANVSRRLRRPDVGVQVIASQSGDDAPTDARLVAGPTPPKTADLHAATVEIRGVTLTVRTWER